MACSTPGEGTWVREMKLDDSGGGGDGNGGDGDGVVCGGKGDARPRRLCQEEKRIVSNAVLLMMVRCWERR
jgi:hypothetical protein